MYQKAFDAEINCLLRYSDAKWEDFHRELSEKQPANKKSIEN